MEELYDFIIKHAERGSCTCGRCIDAPENPTQPQGHTAELGFFKVAVKDSPDPQVLRRLITENKAGSWNTVNVFDGQEHNYIELGGWLGDQGAALMLMGLGSLLGLWRLMTPMNVLGLDVDDPLCKQLCGAGMISIKADPDVAV